jgi:hypothetical protein
MLFDILRSPLSIDGKRVRLGIAGAADLQQWELQNYREQEARNLAQEQSRSGARLLAEWVTGRGVDHVEDLYGMDPDPDPDES